MSRPQWENDALLAIMSPMPFGNESTWDRAHHMILIFNGQERPQNGTCPVTANHERRGRASKVNNECKLLKLSCL